MWPVVHGPPAGLLARARGGVAVPFEARYTALRAAPYAQPAERTAVLWAAEQFVDDVGRVTAEGPAETEPDDHVVVYHRLRFLRRAAQRYMLRLALTVYVEDHGNDPTLFSVLDAYRACVDRAARDARDPALLVDAEAVIDRAAAVAEAEAGEEEPAAGAASRARILRVVCDLLRRMVEDVQTFRGWRQWRRYLRQRRRSQAEAAAAAEAAADECVVCLDARPDAPALRPCGHRHMCRACAKRVVDRCPLCRAPIERPTWSLPIKK
jgi:hypothetical protein